MCLVIVNFKEFMMHTFQLSLQDKKWTASEEYKKQWQYKKQKLVIYVGKFNYVQLKRQP